VSPLDVQTRTPQGLRVFFGEWVTDKGEAVGQHAGLDPHHTQEHAMHPRVRHFVFSLPPEGAQASFEAARQEA